MTKKERPAGTGLPGRAEKVQERCDLISLRGRLQVAIFRAWWGIAIFAVAKCRTLLLADVDGLNYREASARLAMLDFLVGRESRP